ncbi:MAG: GHKL domain-containing protein [Desulfobacterales bacterium]|jgi:two-component system, NtrC family, sensor histidine kinase HydH|nr:GHKL domain-containing protein [Desulfobacteraceae bacterium]MBT4364396.1 GHKL domain-containing protein [Desulfobacteraceae bacterium]MBT7085708.1 GHKL domain-containing protein [Desulfobacterales bacterium]MBT7696243.1 GHKL domain-containing protein [Desulfobacterales bacterium]
MKNTPEIPENDYYGKLKWLMFFRVLFGTLLLGSTIAFRLSENTSPTAFPLLFLYGLICGILTLSLIYLIIFQYVKQYISFVYVQLGIDTFIITLIIFVTGSFSSVFTFLYLLVIICASMLLFRRGSMITAMLCSVQYGIMVDLEYLDILKPLNIQDSLVYADYEWSFVCYKVLTTMIACFGVAFLSGFLAEQERKAKKELITLEDHVQRVEKMAAIGEMAAGLAHEIKNPLASLSGSIQLLREDGQSDVVDNDKLMQIILREADRLSDLVNNFLLFAKPQHGNVEVVSLDIVLEEIVCLFEKDDIHSGRITFSKEFDSRIMIEIDPGHLRQILWNLLLNAAESIEHEGEINIKLYSGPNQNAFIRITDNGCGMTSETIKTIFVPFFTTKTHGNGLGLSIVHRIMESYNTRLDVESEPGVGTTISLNFKQVVVS